MSAPACWPRMELGGGAAVCVCVGGQRQHRASPSGGSAVPSKEKARKNGDRGTLSLPKPCVAMLPTQHPALLPRDAGWDAAAPALYNVCTVLVQSGVHTCQPGAHTPSLL